MNSQFFWLCHGIVETDFFMMQSVFCVRWWEKWAKKWISPSAIFTITIKNVPYCTDFIEKLFSVYYFAITAIWTYFFLKLINTMNIKYGTQKKLTKDHDKFSLPIRKKKSFYFKLKMNQQKKSFLRRIKYYHDWRKTFFLSMILYRNIIFVVAQ